MSLVDGYLERQVQLEELKSPRDERRWLIRVAAVLPDAEGLEEPFVERAGAQIGRFAEFDHVDGLDDVRAPSRPES